ncbi:MAG: hypothetical protein ACI4GZ_05655 [Ruminococcus sp.]
MKLFLKRDTSSDSSRYIVYDESGLDKYVISGKRTASVEKFYINTPDGRPLVRIRAVPFHIFYAFSISDGNERFTITVNNLSRLSDYHFHGISWRLRREDCSRNFELLDADLTLVMTQNAGKLHSFGAYELYIASPQRELFCIATALCADMVDFADAAQKATV